MPPTAQMPEHLNRTVTGHGVGTVTTIIEKEIGESLNCGTGEIVHFIIASSYLGRDRLHLVMRMVQHL